MNSMKRVHQDEQYKLFRCKATVPENPTNQQLEQTRQDLGLPKKPGYKVPALKMGKFKTRWVNKPVAMAGEKTQS